MGNRYFDVNHYIMFILLNDLVMACINLKTSKHLYLYFKIIHKLYDHLFIFYNFFYTID